MVKLRSRHVSGRTTCKQQDFRTSACEDLSYKFIHCRIYSHTDVTRQYCEFLDYSVVHAEAVAVDCVSIGKPVALYREHDHSRTGIVSSDDIEAA